MGEVRRASQQELRKREAPGQVLALRESWVRWFRYCIYIPAHSAAVLYRRWCNSIAIRERRFKHQTGLQLSEMTIGCRG